MLHPVLVYFLSSNLEQHLSDVLTDKVLPAAVFLSIFELHSEYEHLIKRHTVPTDYPCIADDIVEIVVTKRIPGVGWKYQ